MSYELPPWSNGLKPLYCAWRLEKCNNRRRMHWYRLIIKRKLELAEKGICQEKIRQTCRFLSNESFMRGSLSISAERILEFLNEDELQLSLPLKEGV